MRRRGSKEITKNVMPQEVQNPVFAAFPIENYRKPNQKLLIYLA
jgi:hypothetical protein